MIYEKMRGRGGEVFMEFQEILGGDSTGRIGVLQIEHEGELNEEDGFWLGRKFF
jgi:hypothetical protein